MPDPRPDTRSGAPSTGGRVLVMGIVNVTPDSFWDGGRLASTEAAIVHGLALASDGADWLDIGGESTRPGSAPVSEQEERARVLPVVEGLAKRSAIPLSIDTRRAGVAEAALVLGARIVNAVAGLRDPGLAAVCAAHDATLVLNHMRGEPATMQHEPVYGDVVREVCDELLAEAARAEREGVAREQIWLDPGLGFGKRLEDNLGLLAELGWLRQQLGLPLLVGPSRKSFLGSLTGDPAPERDRATLAACAVAAFVGADAVRVHDVGGAVRAVAVGRALRDARRGTRP